MRIFISHGLDKTLDDDMAFLDALKQALEASRPAGSGLDVLLDRKHLKGGGKWREVLHEMLAQCDCALILFSKRALKRPWVLKESTVLAYRMAMDESFRVYPVLLEGLNSSALDEEDFSPLCLRELQALKGCETPKVIAAEVKRLLGKARKPAPTPLDLLAERLAVQIKDADSQSLRRLCEQLHGKPIPWRPDQGARTAQYADALARALIRGLTALPSGAATLPPLAALMDELKGGAGLSQERCKTVLNLASPLWVDPNAAVLLADVAGRNRSAAAPAVGISVALNGRQIDFSADRHVRRLMLPTVRKEVVVPLAGGHSDNRLEELSHAVRREYRRAMNLPADEPDPETDRRLAKTDTPIAQAKVVFFIVPEPLPDAALLAELQRRFARVTFILHSGHEASGALPPRVLALPALNVDLEERMQDDYMNALNVIEN